MHLVDLIILIAWIAFWIYWFTAAVGAKAGRARWGTFAGFRVAAVLIVLLLVRTRVLKGHAALNNDPWLEGIGLAVFAAGLALAVWARLYIGRNWGTPMSRKEDPDLVTTGPYHSIRHPIYSGIILAMVGTALAVSWYWFIAVVLLSGYFIYSATVEERYMTGLFPDAYPDYKNTTKMLIPFVL
jgi:protein-S-isoprenylcysteine O-methyltransferase Ste14